MLTYGFFNSVNGDRKYNADTISDMFKGLVSDGVYKKVGDMFEVTPNTGLTLNIKSGRAVAGRRWVVNDATISVTLGAAHVTYGRYDAIVLEANDITRDVSVQIIKGTPSESPEKPDIVRNSHVYDICLAYVYVGAGANTITSADIEDTRADSEVCGYVHLLVSSSLDRFRASVTTSAAVSTILIPEGADYEAGDLLTVYIDGLYLDSSTDYTIINNNGVFSVKFTNEIDSGAVVSFENIKSIILGETDISMMIDAINGEVI